MIKNNQFALVASLNKINFSLLSLCLDLTIDALIWWRKLSQRRMIMASVAENSKLSDVEWLVMRARAYSKNDHYSAKAWLITARSLYPRCFLIQVIFQII
jgi:hypothetical protein